MHWCRDEIIRHSWIKWRCVAFWSGKFESVNIFRDRLIPSASANCTIFYRHANQDVILVFFLLLLPSMGSAADSIPPCTVLTHRNWLMYDFLLNSTCKRWMLTIYFQRDNTYSMLSIRLMLKPTYVAFELCNQCCHFIHSFNAYKFSRFCLNNVHPFSEYLLSGISSELARNFAQVPWT